MLNAVMLRPYGYVCLAPDAPLHVAEVVAELWQGRTIPFPDRPGSYITLALDAYGTVMMQPENLTAMLDAATA